MAYNSWGAEGGQCPPGAAGKGGAKSPPTNSIVSMIGLNLLFSLPNGPKVVYGNNIFAILVANLFRHQLVHCIPPRKKIRGVVDVLYCLSPSPREPSYAIANWSVRWRFLYFSTGLAKVVFLGFLNLKHGSTKFRLLNFHNFFLRKLNLSWFFSS